MSWIRPTSTIIAAACLGSPAHAAVPAFQDATLGAGVTAVHATSGFSHWDYTGGGAVGDFNRDGWQDIFVVSGGDGGMPDRLFMNDGDGTFTDQAAAWGLTDIHKGKGAAVGDVNGDGWPDLLVTSAGPLANMGPGHHRLYRNNADGTFTDIADAAGVAFTTLTVEDGFGAGFGDFDLDGDLDLFVAGFADGNAGSRLFENDGGGTFTDITDTIGFFDGTPINLRSFAPRFADMDGDWYPEMLLVSDFGTNRYFGNDGDGTFTDLTDVSGADLVENGMGQCVGDFDGDGLLDWYVTSIFFPQVSWTGNKLFLNTGNHTYSEEAAARRVDDGGYGWGSVAVDFDHDGLLDIAETNGSESGTVFDDEQAYLWIQQANGTFLDKASVSGFVHTGQGRGMARLDIDNDGDQDVVILANNEPLMLLRNDVAGADANWLRVFLDTRSFPTLAPFGTGARVHVTVGADTWMRYMSSGDHFLTHSELSAHFGLAGAALVDELRVDWPDGSSTALANVAVNQTLHLSPAGLVAAGDLDADGAIGITDLLELLAQWGACPAWGGCTADLDGSGAVDVVDLLALLAGWTAEIRQGQVTPISREWLERGQRAAAPRASRNIAAICAGAAFPGPLPPRLTSWTPYARARTRNA